MANDNLEYTGLTLQDVRLERAYARILHPADVEQTQRVQGRVLSERVPFEMEARIRAKTGEYRWFLIRVNPLKDKNGRVVRWYGLRTDIEELKSTEDELRRSEFYLAEGQRLAQSGSWAFTPSGFFDHWSRELFQIYGLDPAGKHGRIGVAESVPADFADTGPLCGGLQMLLQDRLLPAWLAQVIGEDPSLTLIY